MTIKYSDCWKVWTSINITYLSITASCLEMKKWKVSFVKKIKTHTNKCLYGIYLNLRLKIYTWGTGTRWQHRKTLTSPPPTDTLNVFKLTETFLLKKNRGLIEQFLCYKPGRDHIKNDRRDERWWPGEPHPNQHPEVRRDATEEPMCRFA